MPDKPLSRLLPLDRWMRGYSPCKGMTNRTVAPQIRITLIRGFELFNTRPHHNHETWSDGYRIEAFDPDGNPYFRVEREDLDDALRDAEALLMKLGTGGGEPDGR